MRTNYCKEEILQFAEKENVRFVRLQFTDMMGILKNVEIPVHQLPKALDNKISFDGSSIDGFVRIEESDMFLHPDLSTWMIFPWTNPRQTIARIICDIHMPDGAPFAGDPRIILKNAIHSAKRYGYELSIGSEPEFFLLRLGDHGEPTLTPNDDGGYFDIAPTDLGESCRRSIAITLQKMGISIDGSHHEVAPGQHEIDLTVCDALQAADHLMTCRMVVKTISHQHGLHATFMPKPIATSDGSGLHLHQTLSYSGSNVFFSEKDEYGLSAIGKNYIAGIMQHAPAVTAITNPLVNSYKRLVPGYEAPVYIAWSTKNRSPFIRVTNFKQDTQVELRSPDPACNPYLAFACILTAGLDGIKQNTELPDPIHENIYNMSSEERLLKSIFQLPSNLEQAIEALEEDDMIQSALGAYAYSRFSAAKLMEWDIYRKVVHPWEREQYIKKY